MSDPFVGEIKMIAFTYAPKDWSYCDGQILPISQNATLYSLLGTQFGGNGTTTFALPDLRSRTPMHPNFSNFNQGNQAGQETVALDNSTMPMHTHTFVGSSADGTSLAVNPTDTVSFANAQVGGAPADIYGPATNLVELAPGTCTSFGSGRAHENCQPSTVLGFVLALSGLYPSRN